MSDRLYQLADAVAPYVPPALGALLGLRYAQNQTNLQKVTSWATGTLAGIYLAPWVGELLDLGPRGTVAVGFLIGFAGYDLMLGLTALMRQFGTNPLGTIRDALGAWFKRGGP